MMSIQVVEPWILWLFGIPASGKSVLATQLRDRISPNIEILDSDNLREQLTPNPTFSDYEREMFYRSLWEIAIRLRKHGISVIISAAGGGVDLDLFVKNAPHPSYFILVDCPLEIARDRDPKGLYRQAERGVIRLPLIRRPFGEDPLPEDINFCRRFHIKGYEIRFPSKIDLVLESKDNQSIGKNVDKVVQLISSRTHNANSN